jgi:hypothetical protein
VINLIYNYTDIDVLKEVLEGLNLPLITISEMLENTYLILIEAERVTELEDALKQPPLKMEFVGSYNIDGSQYIWTAPTEIQRNHSINKYKDKLRNYIVYDEDGEIIEDRPYTIEEAKSVQVNKIYGNSDRILE